MNAINGKTIILSFLLILVLVVPAVAGTEDLGNDTGTDLEIQGDYSALAVLNDEDLVCDSSDSCSCAPEFSSGETSGDAANTAVRHPLGYIQPPNPIADRSPLDVSVLTLGDGVSIMADEPLPESYDLRVHGRMTPVKNQLDCGSCWAFAAYGSLESVLIGVEGDESDFSENNMKNKHGFDPGCCEGGSSEMAAAYLARWAVPDDVTWYSGPVSESDDPYDNFSCVSPDSLEIQKHVQDVYFLPVQSPADNSLVKSILMDYGAVFAGFQVNRSQGFNMAGASPAYYYNSSEGMLIDGGHGITIAGWDDSFSKDNFRVTPPGDGAYLIKNSWGSDWGNDSGYFYISYYDEDINRYMALFTAESIDNYDSVYYYDAFGATNFINMVGTTTSSFGNVFPSFGNETIRAAGVYTYQAGAVFEAEVHLNPDDGPENSTAGAVSYVNGTFDLPGFHTVDFETPVEISSDDTFSVIFTVTNPSSISTIPVEQKIANYTSAATSAPGDSYYLASNGHWADAYDLTGFDRPSICIKAYTTFDHVGPAPVANFTASPLSGAAPLSVQFNDTSENAPTAWSWNFGDGNSSMEQNPVYTYPDTGVYNVSLTVTNAGGSDSMEKSDYITVTDSRTGTKYEYDHSWGEFGQEDGRFYVPFGVAVNSSGSIYVADMANNRVQVFDPDGTFITKWGSAGKGDGEFNSTTGIAIDSGDNVYVADRSNSRIQKFNKNGGFLKTWGSYGNGSGELNQPTGIAVDSSDNIYVADAGNSRVQKFDSDGNFLKSWGGPGINYSEFSILGGIAVGPENSVYVTDMGFDYVKKFTSDGEFVTMWGGNGDSNGKFENPLGISTDSSGNVFVADYGNDRIQIFSSDGGFLARFTDERPSQTLGAIYGLAFSSENELFVPEAIHNRIVVFVPNGTAPLLPAADFNADQTSGSAPLAVNFTDSSQNTPTSWNWDFGDGNTSTQQNPVHIYLSPGSYNVTLAVANAAGTDSITKSDFVTVTGSSVEAEFDLNRNFVAFSDNNTFTTGTYTVNQTYRMHAENRDTAAALGDLVYTAGVANITSVEYSPFATWNSTYAEWNFPSIYAIGPGSSFDTGAYTSYTEEKFYNHTITRVSNTSVFRTPGVQGTNITVVFNDLDFESVFVGFGAAKDLNMTAEIIGSSVVTNAPLAVPLPPGGDYHLKLDKSALTTGTEYYFRFSTLITPNATAVIHKPIAYVWEGISHDSEDLGTVYKAEVPAAMLPSDATGFSIETNTSCDWSFTWQNNDLSVLAGASERVTTPPPAAAFSATPLTGAAVRQVNFTDLSTGNPDSRLWSFGDGNTSTEKNPVYSYLSEGTYTVSLTVTNAGGSDTMTKADYITVYKKGDFNGNGFVDIGDVSKVAYMVADLTPVDMAADFNGNGEVDVGDAAIIAWYFVGKTGSL